uniref:RxLR effector candidate protein n=1 Tax=Hyaloperonospora arabidopsidis (strain Emoy2) TaxID=559515 RepID=M4B5U3_HYAAE
MQKRAILEGGTLTPPDHKLVTLDFDLRALRGLADVKNEHVIAKMKRAWQNIFLSVTARTAPCTENIARCTSPTYRREGQPRTNDVQALFTLRLRPRRTLSSTCRLSSMVMRWILSFLASRTNNVNFGSSSTTTTRKTSRLSGPYATDFCTGFENAAKLLLGLLLTRNSPSLNSLTARLTCLKTREPSSDGACHHSRYMTLQVVIYSASKKQVSRSSNSSRASSSIPRARPSPTTASNDP